jgi:hypothetical protein
MFVITGARYIWVNLSNKMTILFVIAEFHCTSSSYSYCCNAFSILRTKTYFVITFHFRCQCDITASNQLQVTCHGHFNHDFPLEKLRKDVEILHIEPNLNCAKVVGKSVECNRTENQISLGPIYQHLRLLKELRIRFSQVPNIGHRTMWGLSGLKLLDLSHNRLTNVVEQNFEGLYSLKELCLSNNQVNIETKLKI